MNTNIVVVIPARYASSRFPGKPLAPLVGATGIAKSLIERSWNTAMQVDGVSAVYVATDDDRIAEAAHAFGAKVLMTSADCQNGTERVAEAVKLLDSAPDIVLNLQGDSPLTPPWFLTSLIEELCNDSSVEMATPVLRCDGQTLQSFRDDRKNGLVGGTTAIFDKSRDALYFSKEVIPYIDGDYEPTQKTPVFHHVGVYAYRCSTLQAYVDWGVGSFEKLEGLEQLRFLENGKPVRCVTVEAPERVFWELNNSVDVARIEGVLLKEGWE